MIWESDNGITTQWTAMGEGCVDFKTFFKIFRKQCPDVTVHIETISGFPKSFPIYEHDFWNLFPNALAKDFSAFLALAKKRKSDTHFSAGCQIQAPGQKDAPNFGVRAEYPVLQKRFRA